MTEALARAIRELDAAIAVVREREQRDWEAAAVVASIVAHDGSIGAERLG